jgi:hypothetical protein
MEWRKFLFFSDTYMLLSASIYLRIEHDALKAYRCQTASIFKEIAQEFNT